MPEKAEEQAAQLLEMAIENFKSAGQVGRTGHRAPDERGRGRLLHREHPGGPGRHPRSPAGRHQERAPSGAWPGWSPAPPCATPARTCTRVAVAKELIKRDILVLSMGCGNGAMQVAGLCLPEAAELAGPGLKGLCESLGVPPVLSYGTCTDTGRIADLMAAISAAPGRRARSRPAGRRLRARVHGAEGHHRRRLRAGVRPVHLRQSRSRPSPARPTWSSC